MDRQISTRVKNRRHREAMKLQQKIVLETALAFTDKVLNVLVETAEPRTHRA